MERLPCQACRRVHAVGAHDDPRIARLEADAADQRGDAAVAAAWRAVAKMLETRALLGRSAA